MSKNGLTSELLDFTISASSDVDGCSINQDLDFSLLFFLKGQIIDILVISGGLNLQQLGAGLGFPARDQAGLQQGEHQTLAARPVVSNKGPGPSALQKSSHKDGK